MALLLRAIISQRLIVNKEGSLVAAVEILFNNPTIGDLLTEGKTRALYKAMKEGGYFGCQTFNQSLKELVDGGVVEEETALIASDSPEELKMALRGITRGKGNY